MCKCLWKKIVENGGLNTRARDMRKWLRRAMERWFWWLAKSVVRAFEVLGRHFSYFDIANSIYNSLNPVKSCNFPKAKMIEVSWWYIVYYKKPLKMKMWFSWLRICGYCVSRYFGDILGYSSGWKKYPWRWLRGCGKSCWSWADGETHGSPGAGHTLHTTTCNN